jgi:hypothetical protein
MNKPHAGIAQLLAEKGRGGDSMLVHMAPSEVAGLQSFARKHGTSLTVNPETGLPEAFSLKDLGEGSGYGSTLAGAALGFLGIESDVAGVLVGASQLISSGGDFGKGVVAGMSAYGGAELEQGLEGTIDKIGNKLSAFKEGWQSTTPETRFTPSGDGAEVSGRGNEANAIRLPSAFTEDTPSPQGGTNFLMADDGSLGSETGQGADLVQRLNAPATIEAKQAAKPINYLEQKPPAWWESIPGMKQIEDSKLAHGLAAMKAAGNTPTTAPTGIAGAAGATGKNDPATKTLNAFNLAMLGPSAHIAREQANQAAAEEEALRNSFHKGPTSFNSGVKYEQVRNPKYGQPGQPMYLTGYTKGTWGPTYTGAGQGSVRDMTPTEMAKYNESGQFVPGAAAGGLAGLLRKKHFAEGGVTGGEDNPYNQSQDYLDYQNMYRNARNPQPLENAPDMTDYINSISPKDYAGGQSPTGVDYSSYIKHTPPPAPPPLQAVPNIDTTEYNPTDPAISSPGETHTVNESTGNNLANIPVGATAFPSITPGGSTFNSLSDMGDRLNDAVHKIPGVNTIGEAKDYLLNNIDKGQQWLDDNLFQGAGNLATDLVRIFAPFGNAAALTTGNTGLEIDPNDPEWLQILEKGNNKLRALPLVGAPVSLLEDIGSSIYHGIDNAIDPYTDQNNAKARTAEGATVAEDMRDLANTPPDMQLPDDWATIEPPDVDVNATTQLPVTDDPNSQEYRDYWHSTSTDPTERAAAKANWEESTAFNDHLWNTYGSTDTARLPLPKGAIGNTQDLVIQIPQTIHNQYMDDLHAGRVQGSGLGTYLDEMLYAADKDPMLAHKLFKDTPLDDYMTQMMQEDSDARDAAEKQAGAGNNTFLATNQYGTNAFTDLGATGIMQNAGAVTGGANVQPGWLAKFREQIPDYVSGSNPAFTGRNSVMEQMMGSPFDPGIHDWVSSLEQGNGGQDSWDIPVYAEGGSVGASDNDLFGGLQRGLYASRTGKHEGAGDRLPNVRKARAYEPPYIQTPAQLRAEIDSLIFGDGSAREEDEASFAMGGMAGGGDTVPAGCYAAGGRLLDGPGDGMSDSIPAMITGEEPQRAALADGEFVIPADVVSHLGNGSTKAGADRLYDMLDDIRKARTGRTEQAPQINANKFLPR